MILLIMTYCKMSDKRYRESFAKGKVTFRETSVSRCKTFDHRALYTYIYIYISVYTHFLVCIHIYVYLESRYVYIQYIYIYTPINSINTYM